MMMKRILILLLGTVAMFQTASAQDEPIVISPQEYGELKAAGELEEGAVYVMEESINEETLHPEIYDANLQATAGRNAACDCWVEPDDTYTSLNLSDDATSGPIPLPFDFCLYGTDWNSVYINSNGNVTFGSGFTTYTPSGFPMGTAMVAPFWADVDPGEGGEILYKVTEDAIYINYVDVPHYNGTTNLVNTFQVILTNGENEFLGADRNVSFCYQDMQWTTGDISGSGGFGGSAATVGANEGDNTTFIQFGRFNQNNDNYDGPFGADDGIDFLDDQSFTFTACADLSDNVAPVATGIGNCDTLFVCQGESVDFSTQFLAPENNQDVTITFDDGGIDGFSDIEIIDGDVGEFNATFTGSLDNVGTFDVTLTATDDGSPAASTTVTITIVVTEEEIPLFEISGDTTFCGGGSTILHVPEGFDEYNWSTGCEEDSCEVDQSGTYTVQGILGNCDATASIDVEEGDFFVPPYQPANEPICSNDSTLVTSTNEYVSYNWDVYQDYPGTVYSDDPTGQTVYVSSGTFILTVETEDGCIGQRIFNISSTDAVIPEDDISGLYCDGPQEVEFFGAYSDATEGSVTLYLINTQEPGWQGGSVDVFVDGELQGNFTLEGGNQASYSIPVTYGEYIEIIYNSGSNDSGNIINFTNCGGSPVFDEPGIAVNTVPSGIIFEGYSGCNSEPAYGSWSVTGPDYEIINNDEDDNDYDIIFDAQDYGQYELCFTDSVCGLDYCYDLEISETPETQLDEEEVLVCDEDEFVIEPEEIDPAGDATGQWNTGDPAGPLTVTESGEYCYTLSNQCGQSTSCIDVTISSLPDPVLSDTLVCGGSGSVILDPIDNDPGYVYSWTGGSADGSTDPQVEATESGTYIVTVTSPCGSQEAVAEVSIFPDVNPIIQTDNTLICDGTSAELELTGAADGNIEWSTNETSNSIVVEQSGEYCVTVSNECESAEDCIDITIAEDPTVNILNEDFILCAGDPQTIQTESSGTFGGVYIWTTPFSNEPLPATGESLTVYSDDIPQDFLGGPIPYTVTVNGPCGTSSDEVFVTAAVCEVIIPNIISPNNDNKNEGFYIQGIEYFSSVQLKIFDRWGKLVFSDDSYSNDEAWEAKDLNEGVYYYTLVLPTEEFSGYITVVR